MPKFSKEALLKMMVAAAIAGAVLMIYWPRAMRAYFLWSLHNNVYDDDREIADLANDMSRFGLEMIPEVIERVNPEVCKSIPGRRVAQGAVLLYIDGSYDESDILDRDHSSGEAADAYELLLRMWEKNKDKLKWDPRTRKLSRIE